MAGLPNYIQRHKRDLTFTFLLIMSLILIVFSNRNVVIKPKEMGQTLFSVFQMGMHRLSNWFSDTWNSINELKKLQEDLEQARSKIIEYERVSRDVAELRRDNERLREQLQFSRRLPFQQVPAEVIARDPGNEFSTLMINKGSKHGVRRGMPVIALQEGFQGLVGKIVQVGLASAIVKPITDPTSYVAARLQSSRYDGLINGRQLYSGSLMMRYVKKLAVNDIQYGEPVITSGMGRLFPPGIHIGRVREIQAKNYEASLGIEIEPIIDFSKLEYVFVLSGGSEEWSEK